MLANDAVRGFDFFFEITNVALKKLKKKYFTSSKPRFQTLLLQNYCMLKFRNFILKRLKNSK